MSDFAIPELPPDALSATCVHEAAHVVVAESLGIPVIYATSREGNGSAGHVRLETPDDVIGVAWQARAVLAGPVAQQAWVRGRLTSPLQLEHFGGKNDIDQAEACCETEVEWETGAEPDPDRVTDRLAAAVKDTVQLVSEHWAAIGEVAIAMRKRRLLLPHDVREAIARCTT